MLIRLFQLFASDGPYIVSVVDDEPILGPLLKQPDKHKLIKPVRKLAFRQTANLTTGSRGGAALRQPLEFPWCEAKFPFCLCVRSASQTG
jgi:hypothetical protein